jgi:hypothetical protein
MAVARCAATFFSARFLNIRYTLKVQNLTFIAELRGLPTMVLVTSGYLGPIFPIARVSTSLLRSS